MLSDATLSIARRLALNLHTGVSLRYRGADCEFWALHNREPEFIGATVHACTSDLDGGRIFGITTAKLEADDRLGTVFGRCVVAGRKVDAVSQDLSAGKEYKVAMHGWRAELCVDTLIRQWFDP